MRVVRSRVLGFCMGVRRAVRMAHAEADRVKIANGKVYTIGPLIHNPEVLNDLKEKGLKELTDYETELENNIGIFQYNDSRKIPDSYPKPDNAEAEIKNDFSVIIRAHGIDPVIEEDLRKRGAKMVDATCPHVKNSQLKAKALTEAGYKLFLAGDPQHAEISGILGYTMGTGEEIPVVSNTEEAEEAAKKLYETDKDAKTALIGQTTISDEEYRRIGKTILKYFPNLEIVQTICTATKDRQMALRDLLSEVDAVLIAGGKESANTLRLLAIAQESGKPCALVENASQIPAFFYACSTVGLSAGASTPDFIIDEIETELLR